MAEQFVFTFNGAYLKAVVNAYRQLVDTFVFHFTRENIKACVMSTDRYRLIEIVFTPYDYRAHVDEVWVQGDMGLLWGAVKKLKKADTVTVKVEDDKFYVGPVQPGEVVPEEWIEPEQKFDLEFPAYFEQVVVGSLKVVVAGFKKILRSAPPDTTFLGIDIDEPGGHILLGESVVDLGARVPHEWLLGVSGKAREAYTLDLFTSLLVSGLIENAHIYITEKAHVIVEYAEDQCTVKLYMSAPGTASRVEGRDTITEILARPKPVRTEILRMFVRVGDLFKAVKAIKYLAVFDEVTIDPSEGLGLFWKEGYLKVPARYLETWTPPSEPVAGDFNLEDLVRFLKDVEDLSLYLDEVEGDKRLVLRGTGPKIAPKELEAFEMKIKVPEVVGPEEFPKVIFAGPVDLLLRTVEDAKVAEDTYLVFYTTPYEIEVFGRNEVYYEATFELNDFQAMVEDDYIPIGSDAFSELIGFFKNVPAEWCGMGKTEKNDIFLSVATDIGEFRGFKTNYMVKEAIKAYEERIKRPVAPPEAEKLPEAPPLKPEVTIPPGSVLPSGSMRIFYDMEGAFFKLGYDVSAHAKHADVREAVRLSFSMLVKAWNKAIDLGYSPRYLSKAWEDRGKLHMNATYAEAKPKDDWEKKQGVQYSFSIDEMTVNVGAFIPGSKLTDLSPSLREIPKEYISDIVPKLETPPKIVIPPPPPKLLDPGKVEVAEIRSLTRGPFRFVILNDGTLRVASMGRFLGKEELEGRPELLEEAQGYFLEELETLGIKPPAFELVTVYPSAHINEFTGVDKKLYGPFEVDEAALIPRGNAEKFVKEHFASWEKPPELPPPPVMKTYAELEKEFEEKDPWDALAIFVSRFEGFKRDYSMEDLHRFLRELRERTSTESVYRFYKIYPQLKDDFVSIARRIGWIPPELPTPPPAKPPRRPPPTRLKPDEVEEVWEQFVAFAKLALIVEPLAYRDRFMETIRTSPTVANAIERARRLVSSIQRELRPPPPTAPPGPPIVPVPDVAEVYRRLGVPPGAPVSEAAFQTVWRAIQRERAEEPPKGLIRSELDYLWREFSDFLGRFDMDPERHRPEFEEVLNPDFNLVENLEGVMKKVHELTDGTRWGPERWK